MINYICDETKTAYLSILERAQKAQKLLDEYDAQLNKLLEQIDTKQRGWKESTAYDDYRLLQDKAADLDWCKRFLIWHERHNSESGITNIAVDTRSYKDGEAREFGWAALNDKGVMMFNGGLINHGTKDKPEWCSHT